MMSRNWESRRAASGLVVAVVVALCVVSPAVAQDAKEVEEGWTGDLALSISAQTGSVDTFAGTVDSGIERLWTEDDLRFRFTGAYGTSRDSKNDPSDEDSQDDVVQDTQTLRGDWKHRLAERWFWESGSMLSRDSTQDLDVRYRLATGPGYRVWQGEDSPKQHFDVSAGVGYRYEIYDGNTGPSTENDTLGDLVVDNGTDSHLADLIAKFDYKNILFDGKIIWSHTGGIAMPANKTGAFIVTTEAIASIPITAGWSFRTGLFYEYVNDVPDNINPSTFRATVGVGYEF